MVFSRRVVPVFDKMLRIGGIDGEREGRRGLLAEGRERNGEMIAILEEELEIWHC